MSLSGDYFIRGIPAPHVDKFWKLAEPYIKRALDRANGELDHHDLRAMIAERNVQLWMVSNKERIVGALTTEIVVYPRKKVVRVITLAGNEFTEWFPVAEEVIIAFGIEQGCEGIESFVRNGLTKRLAPSGYKKIYEVNYKPFY